MANGVRWCRLVCVIVAGETGAAALAGFEALVTDEGWRDAANLLTDRTVLIVVTEGATDPANYEKVVGRGPTRSAGSSPQSAESCSASGAVPLVLHFVKR